MKTLKYIFITYCIYFLFIMYVEAGVCDNRPIVNSIDNTCESEKTYRFDLYSYNKDKGYSVYKTVSNYSYSGEQEFALCIDPGKSAPYYKSGGSHIPFNYNYVRDINTSGYDLYFYRIYQKYVNAVGYYPSGKNTYLQQVDIMSRYLIHHEFPGWALNGSTYDKNKLLKNSAAKKFYDDAMTMSLWENPLKFDTSVEYDASNELYTFKIDVNFINATSQYFFGDSTGLINGDFDIGYGNSFFEYEFQINDGAYDFNNAESYLGNINGRIDKNTSNPNNNLSFQMKMTKSIYDAIMASQGKVYLNLKYSTYNPMSDENVIFVKRHKYDSTNQRMLVFTKYIKNGNISTEKIEQNKCEQVGNKFYYEGNETSISDFKLNCSCNAINQSLLTDEILKEYYNQECVASYVPVNDVNYNNNITQCSNNESDNYLINKKTNSTINKYCSLKCDESINFNDVMGKYSTKAGTYFELNKYPKLIANKNCNVKVDYSTWKSDYDTLVTNQTSAMTEWNKYVASLSPLTFEQNCGCSPAPCTPTYATVYYIPSGTFNVYSYSNGVINSSSNGYISWGGCNGNSLSVDSSAQSRFNTITGELTNHFESLKTCSGYLDNLGDMNKYYDFKVGLNYYYYQDYKKYGVRRNDNKVNGNIDDSKLLYNKDYSKELGNYKSYNTNTQNYVYMNGNNSMSNYTAGISSNMYNVNITRQVNYGYSFYPTVNKYVESYTAIINSNKTYLNNPILLGKVYDTDVSAIPKSDNDNYFSFSSLGEKNNIYNYYKSVNPKKLNRYCTYEITSDILDKCTGDNCTGDEDLKSKLVYRIVDSNDLDPNDRLGTDDGLKNWNNIKGKTVLKEIESSSVFNSENLEYSFTLDSAAIKEIRKYNNGCDDNMKNCDNPIKYSNVKESYSELECNSDGNECTSKFITELEKNNGYFGNSIATNISGRDRWKYLDYDNEKGYFINEFKRGKVNYESLSTKLENKGVEVTP